MHHRLWKSCSRSRVLRSLALCLKRPGLLHRDSLASVECEAAQRFRKIKAITQTSTERSLSYSFPTSGWYWYTSFSVYFFPNVRCAFIANSSTKTDNRA